MITCRPPTPDELFRHIFGTAYFESSAFTLCPFPLSAQTPYVAPTAVSLFEYDGRHFCVCVRPTLTPTGSRIPTVPQPERMYGFGLHEPEKPKGLGHARSGLRACHARDLQVRSSPPAFDGLSEEN